MAYKFDQPIYENGKRVITQDGFESLVNNALADASFASAEAVAEAVEDQRAREGYVKATDLDHLISAKLQAPYEPGDGFSTFHFDLRQYAIGWLEAAPANRNMSQASLACVGDRFYFFGCYNGSAPAQSTIGMIYEPLANAWSRFDCPIAMADSSAVAVGTDIYVCGGFTEIYNIHKYDTLTGLWSNESRVPASSYSMRETSACHYNGNLYIAGGHSSQQALRIYNLSTKTWSMSALNSDGVTQNTQCAVAYDGYVYACNGVYSNPNYILRYSIAGNSWEIVVTAPTAYTSKATVYAGDGLVYLLSGIADNRTNVTYSLDTGIFGSLPPLPTALPGRNIGCCWHGRVYIFGHGQAGALENHTYYYYPIPAAVTLLKCGAGDKVYANAELYGRVSGLIQRYKETIIEANDYIEYHTADCAAEVTGYVERD